MEKLNKYSENGTVIDNTLILKEDGFLGEGTAGYIYEGSTIQFIYTIVKVFALKVIHFCKFQVT